MTFKSKPLYLSLLIIAVTCLNQPVARGQWQTQTFSLESGWNPVHLHLDATHASISEIIENTRNSNGYIPIEAIWLWSPSVNEAQYVLKPDAPSSTKTRWIEWRESLGDNSSSLKSLVGNASYLVKLKDGEPTTELKIQGKPLPPNYNWTSSGLNFVGFPVNDDNDWNLESYFIKAGSFLSTSTFYNYTAGDLGSNNPAKVYGERTTSLLRGRAYWLDTGSIPEYYYGPFKVTLQNFKGLHFGNNSQTSSLRIRNVTNSDLNLKLSTVLGEVGPEGTPLENDLQKSLMIRRERDPETQLYNFEACPCDDVEIKLAPKGEPGQEVEIVVGINRTLLDGDVGQNFSSIFRIEDTYGQSRVDLPTTAIKQSYDGLWIGEALVDAVSRGNSTTPEAVAKKFPLRFIFHQQSIKLTTSASVAAGNGVNVPVKPLATKLDSGDKIIFPNGSELFLTEAAGVNSTNLIGNLELTIETTSETEQGATALAVEAIKTTFPSGTIITFADGSMFTTDANAPANSTELSGNLVQSGGIPQKSLGSVDFNDALLGENYQGSLTKLQMLQRIYAGKLISGEEGLATSQSLLDINTLEEASRISTTQLPFSDDNETWPVDGSLGFENSFYAAIQIDHDDQIANPFIHTYHPDHDNLDADFENSLPQGHESFSIHRQFRFTIAPANEGFTQIVAMGNSLSGVFEEELRLKGKFTNGPLNENNYTIKGGFKLVRISDISKLSRP